MGAAGVEMNVRGMGVGAGAATAFSSCAAARKRTRHSVIDCGRSSARFASARRWSSASGPGRSGHRSAACLPSNQT